MKKITILLLAITCIIHAGAQDKMTISGTKKIGPTEIFTVKPGTVVSFEPGAILWVEGKLLLNGTKESPIQFVSSSPENPGQGVVVTGDNPNAFIQVNNVKFVSLSMPISFEPFWNRKEVQITQCEFSKSNGNEPVLFMATPQVTLGENPIKVVLKNNQFKNNQSGILLEYAGGKGLNYEIDNLTFQENGTNSPDGSIGNLHLDLAKPFAEENITIGNLIFIGSKESKSQSGVSLGGNPGKVTAQNLFTNNGERWVYDAQKDPRLGSFEAKVSTLENSPQQLCYFNYIKHKSNLILTTGKGNCKASSLQDSSGQNIPFIQTKKGDSLIIQYQGNSAHILKMDNDLLIKLPQAEPDIQDNAMLVPDPEPKKDSILPKPEIPWTKTYEAGIWGGFAFYVGDVKHRFGIPGVYEYTGGFYAQINKTPKISYRIGFNRTNIGMHDPTAPGMIWRSADNFGMDEDGNVFVIESWDMNFKTKMYILDFDMVYYFAQKQDYRMAFINDNVGRWIPGIGVGAGLMYFDPYKCVLYHRDKDTAQYVRLRPLGTQGQNYQGNGRSYLPLTLNVNLSFQLAYAYKNWRFKYEFKTVFSFSDYLDDMGHGYIYGGDYDEWKKSVEGVEMPIDKKSGTVITVDRAFPNYTSVNKRTNNLLPDMFFPQHIGVSYCFGSNQKKKDKK